jgi:5-(carboxyamino)imidazole ribonucleotide synthase
VTAPILPGAIGSDGWPATLGVMGGGQLGRMFVHAAQSMGYRTAVLDPDPASPAGSAADEHILSGYLDPSGLAQLAQRCAAITTEFENVPAEALRTLAAQRPVSPGAQAVAICQHRAEEKAHFLRSGVPCAPHARIETADDLARIDGDLFPGLLKTSQLGYDGKGQVAVTAAADLVAAWAELNDVPCLLEKRLPLARELSVIVARNAAGESVNLPVQQNLHRAGILALTQVPAPDIAAETAALAIQQATRLAASMDYVGVLCVEFFVLDDGSLVANEMAPRPHNSGHYSIDACDVSQFGLQVRAMAGLPLVQPRLHSAALMLNLLGELWFEPGSGRERTPPWAELLALPGVHLHLYGKSGARPGRKMGHLTVTAADSAGALAVAREAASRLGLAPF